MERGAFVAGACAGDTDLRSEVLSLLGALDRAGDLLEPPPAAARPPAAPATPLTGLQFGTYVVGERIGAGGMGVVYRGTDSRLGRTVAIKALPAELADDAHRRARFEHEARVVATLNHPNIAAIYGVEQTPRGPVMVLEHVPGETLAQILSRGRLPVEDVIQIGRQVARALEAAHAAGIVHRDLKPANIKVSPDGTVKVLDFGVAKVVSAESGGTAGLQHTRAGDVVGTASYMSPEQARGKPVDRRTDLWAFGCILFELLTGQQAFPGQTGSDALAAVLRADPEWTRLPAQTPEAVRRLLRRCLEKDSDLRLRDAADARLELEDALLTPPAAAPGGARAGWWARTAAALLPFAAGVVGGVLWLRPGATPAPARPDRFVIETPADAPLRVFQSSPCMALSPDGRQLVFTTRSSSGACALYLRRLDRLEPIELAKGGDILGPCFSPDGRWVAYWDDSAGGQVRKVSVDGTERMTVARCATLYSLAWASDDHMVYAYMNGPGLYRVSADGGEPAVIVPLDTGANQTAYLHADSAPGGDSVVFVCLRYEQENYHTTVDVFRRSTGQRRTLLNDATHPRCFRGGLLYYRDGSLWWVACDLDRLELTGTPRRVLGPLAKGEVLPASRFAVCEAGTLAYLASPITYESSELAWYGASGPPTPVVKTRGWIESLRLSPDGTRVGVAAGWITPDIWVHDLERNTTSRLTDEGNRYYPIWSPDGKRVAYQVWLGTDHNRLDWQLADGSGPPETLFDVPRPGIAYPNAFTPDGRSLILTMKAGVNQREELYIVSLDGDRSARPLLSTPTTASRLGARLSPDGSLIAYTSDMTGNNEIYVQPYPALDQLVRVSLDGGMRPAWTADGRRLFYRWQDRLYEAEIQAGPKVQASVPRLVRASLPELRYDADLDGTRFIMGRTEGGSGQQTRITIVQNWDVELFGGAPSDAPAAP